MSRDGLPAGRRKRKGRVHFKPAPTELDTAPVAPRSIDAAQMETGVTSGQPVAAEDRRHWQSRWVQQNCRTCATWGIRAVSATQSVMMHVDLAPSCRHDCFVALCRPGAWLGPGVGRACTSEPLCALFIRCQRPSRQQHDPPRAFPPLSPPGASDTLAAPAAKLPPAAVSRGTMSSAMHWKASRTPVPALLDAS